MLELSEREEVIWGIIDKNHVGKEHAISQKELFRILHFYPNAIDVPKSLRVLRQIMRKLKTKRPILESLGDKPGYHKPANWIEVENCLGRRKYTAVRQLALNKEMLLACRALFPKQV